MAARRHDAGVVAEQMHRTVSLPGGFGQCLHVAGSGDVGAYCESGIPVRGERITRMLRRCEVDIGEHDLHAGARETPRHRRADAAAATGDDRYTTLKVLHTYLGKPQTTDASGVALRILFKPECRLRRVLLHQRLSAASNCLILFGYNIDRPVG